MEGAMTTAETGGKGDDGIQRTADDGMDRQIKPSGRWREADGGSDPTSSSSLVTTTTTTTNNETTGTTTCFVGNMSDPDDTDVRFVVLGGQGPDEQNGGENGNVRGNSRGNDNNVDEAGMNGSDDGPGSTHYYFADSLDAFVHARGTTELFLIVMMYSFAAGSTVGLAPDILSDRYARISHGYNGVRCDELDLSGGDDAEDDDGDAVALCKMGNDDAKAAAAWCNVASCVLALVCNPVLGSVSDAVGRRPAIALSLSFYALSSAALLVLVLFDSVHPFWYYASYSTIGVVDLTGITFASASDVIPRRYKSACFGILLSSFYIGYAVSPSIPLLMSSIWLSSTRSATAVVAFSFASSAVALVIALAFLPETLQPTAMASSSSSSSADDTGERQPATTAAEEDRGGHPRRHRAYVGALQTEGGGICRCRRLCHTLIRPARELSIVNRGWSVRLVALGAFFSAMVFSSDRTLVVYYIESQLNVGEHDISTLFLVLGLFGILNQGFLLTGFIRCLGEPMLLVSTFVSGTAHNFLYGIATGKSAVYVAFILSQFTKLNQPLLASMASEAVSEDEQGRIQGAVTAINFIGYAAGPISMEYVYHVTKNRRNFGPGFMFLYASFLYLIGLVVVSFLPFVKEKPGREPSGRRRDHERQPPSRGEGVTESNGISVRGNDGHAGDDLEEPLLPPRD